MIVFSPNTRVKLRVQLHSLASLIPDGKDSLRDSFPDPEKQPMT